MKVKVFLFLMISLTAKAQKYDLSHALKDEFGATYRADTTRKVIYLIFTAHEFSDGASAISKSLDKKGIKASFFFTGEFYRRNPKIAANLKQQGHYLGAHSDKHLLYCDWNKRDSMLVDDEKILTDLNANYKELAKLGISKTDALYFMPPFEWYNRRVVELCRKEGLTVINFSPGTSSNADYTTPDAKNYQTSKAILAKINAFEKISSTGLNGFHLLIHFGTDARRTDKLYSSLDEIITNFSKLGYVFRKLE